MHSVTAFLFDLELPSFDTLMHNFRAVYKSQVVKSMNDIIRYLNLLGYSPNCNCLMSSSFYF